MILRPAFHRAMTNDRGAERRALGLEPERPTGIVLFGGHGSTDMLRIARRLPHVQLVFLCGHNAALAERLRALPADAPRAVVGFTSEVWRYLHLGDFFIGKPGPGCLSEALQIGLPVITFENPWTMPQERYNTVWVRERDVGLVVPSVRALAPAVADVIRRLPEFRSRVARIRNRAVYEVLDVFAELLERTSSARMSA
jgi:UDP-N-acetylglucosamine:LPS N-acetylglucosamine transferase